MRVGKRETRFQSDSTFVYPSNSDVAVSEFLSLCHARSDGIFFETIYSDKQYVFNLLQS